MDKFYALSAPLRREIIKLLAESGRLTAGAIAASFCVSPPAISQHLKILRDSKLVHMQQQAQQRIYELNPEAMQELEDWAKQIMQGLKLVGRVTDTLSAAPVEEPLSEEG